MKQPCSLEGKKGVVKSQEESGVVEDIQRENYSWPNSTQFLPKYSIFEHSWRENRGTFSLPKKPKTNISQDFYI